MRKVFLSILAVAFMASTAFASQWKIDTDHSNAFFSIDHMMIAVVRGMFPDVSGTVDVNEDDITKSSVKVKIGVASLNSGVEERDKHLKTADFFDSEKYPSMTFVSKRILKDKGRLRVVGDLTIRGVSKEVELYMADMSKVIEDPWGMTRMGVMAETLIQRSDFGVSWNQKLPNGIFMIGEEVHIILDVELIKQK